MHKCAKCAKTASRAFECSDEGGCFNADEDHLLLSSCTYCSTECFQKARSPMTYKLVHLTVTISSSNFKLLLLRVFYSYSVYFSEC